MQSVSREWVQTSPPHDVFLISHGSSGEDKALAGMLHQLLSPNMIPEDDHRFFVYLVYYETKRASKKNFAAVICDAFGGREVFTLAISEEE